LDNETELKKLSDEFNAGLKAIQDKQEDLKKCFLSKEALDAELKPTVEKVQKIAETLDRVEVKVKDISTKSTPINQKSLEHQAFMYWVKKGYPSELLKPGFASTKEDLPPELKIMKISDDTTGGYLASPELTTDIMKLVATEYSPIRSIAFVRTTGKESVEQRTRTAVFSANWYGEAATANEATGLTFGKERIPVHTIRGYVDITNEDLEDSDYNLEAIFADEVAEAIGALEGNTFISGNVTTRPEGILTNANVGNSNSGNDTTLAADGFITAFFTPKTIYTRNFKWIMARATMATVAKLKNNQNDYLLRRLGDSPVWSIMGADVVECVDMPAVANAAYPVAYGDFRQGYEIVDRTGITILRDPFIQAANGAVRFHFRKRVGGKVMKYEAIYKMLVKA
jgi:HK97 family phage major capsid protein